MRPSEIERLRSSRRTARAVPDEPSYEFLWDPRKELSDLGGGFISTTMLSLNVGARKHFVEGFADGDRFAFVQNNLLVSQVSETEHFLRPEAELSGLDRGALRLFQNSQDVVVALFGDQSFVPLLG